MSILTAKAPEVFTRAYSLPKGSFIWRRGKRAVGIEVKASNRYRSEDAATLREFLQRKLLGSAYVVYHGRDVLQDGGITVLPVAELMRRLARGDVIAS